MATYFSVNKQNGKGNDTVAITPLATFKGRGPVTNTVVISSQDNPTVKGSVTCTKTNALSKGAVTTKGAASSAGEFTVVSTETDKINIPNTAYYLQFAVAATNAKKIYVGLTPSYLSIKIGTKYIQTDNTLDNNQVDVTSKLSSNMVSVPNDPGLTGEFACEIIIGFAANPDAETKTVALNVSVVGSTDSDKNAVFNGNVVQAAADPTLTVTPTTLTWGNTETAAKDVQVKSNDDWTVAIS